MSIWDDFKLFETGNQGIEGWLTHRTEVVTERLEKLSRGQSLGLGELNQLLTLSSEAGMSSGFLKYYFLTVPDHPWDITAIPKFDEQWIKTPPESIQSLEQLYWGLYRLYVDGLLYFGSVRTAYRTLRNLTLKELEQGYSAYKINTAHLHDRGTALALNKIESNDRFLIAEQACKAFENEAQTCEELAQTLWQEYRKQPAGAAGIKIRQFLEEAKLKDHLFALQELGEKELPKSEAGLLKLLKPVFNRWRTARNQALLNTSLYLSQVNELDVYVATSMREKKHFEDMADNCDRIFGSEQLNDLNIRYFDPTMSAAKSHEDKGLVECLMVRCSKVLIYYAGARDSYGKDAEAAMALSLGKPVIFYCEDRERQAFFNQVHPLSRLIEFGSGVAVGAMAVSDLQDIPRLLGRIFTNKMQYDLEKKAKRDGYLHLKERLSGSIVRLQTDDKLLYSAFWNYYHERHHGFALPGAFLKASISMPTDA